jgi:hypothetical protein
MLLSQKLDHKEMQVIHLDQDVQVCGIFHNCPNSKYFLYSLNHESLFWMDVFYLKVWAILFLSFLFLFFWAASKYPLFYYLDTWPFF